MKSIVTGLLRPNSSIQEGIEIVFTQPYALRGELQVSRKELRSADGTPGTPNGNVPSIQEGIEILPWQHYFQAERGASIQEGIEIGERVPNTAGYGPKYPGRN